MIIIDIIAILIIVVWILIYIKNNKATYAIPYLIIPVIVPIYNFLDKEIFIDIFGCGCVPSIQTNMFNIDFNANDLSYLVYNIIAIISIIVGIILSKNIKKRTTKIMYIITIAIFNFMLAFQICKMFMWK